MVKDGSNEDMDYNGTAISRLCNLKCKIKLKDNKESIGSLTTNQVRNASAKTSSFINA